MMKISKNIFCLFGFFYFDDKKERMSWWWESFEDWNINVEDNLIPSIDCSCDSTDRSLKKVRSLVVHWCKYNQWEFTRIIKRGQYSSNDVHTHLRLLMMCVFRRKKKNFRSKLLILSLVIRTSSRISARFSMFVLDIEQLYSLNDRFLSLSLLPGQLELFSFSLFSHSFICVHICMSVTRFFFFSSSALEIWKYLLLLFFCSKRISLMIISYLLPLFVFLELIRYDQGKERARASMCRQKSFTTFSLCFDWVKK